MFKKLIFATTLLSLHQLPVQISSMMPVTAGQVQAGYITGGLGINGNGGIGGLSLYMITTNPPLLSYTIGQPLWFIPNVNCKGNDVVVFSANNGPLPLYVLSNGIPVPISANGCLAGAPYLVMPYSKENAGVADAALLR